MINDRVTPTRVKGCHRCRRRCLRILRYAATPIKCPISVDNDTGQQRGNVAAVDNANGCKSKLIRIFNSASKEESYDLTMSQRSLHTLS